jgi:NUDIX domain
MNYEVADIFQYNLPRYYGNIYNPIKNDGSTDHRAKKFNSKRTSKRSFPINPITSYGIILFTKREDTIKYLIYQHRDSYEYMEFLRGIWNGGEDYLIKILSLMSDEERKRLLTYTFDELWDDLWIEQDINIYRDGYEKAKRKFESVVSYLPSLISQIIPNVVSGPPWGFPKGKKNDISENDLECALREFIEETKLNIEDIHLWEWPCFTEQYHGKTDKKNYATCYYLAEAKCELPISHIETPKCIRKFAVSEEASQVIWTTINESVGKLDHKRIDLLKIIENIIINNYKEKSPIN